MGTGYPHSNSMNTFPTPTTLETIHSGGSRSTDSSGGVAMGRTYSEDTSSGCRDDRIEASSNAPNKASGV
jgi:hypothetical protein